MGILAFTAHELELLRETIVRALVRAGSGEGAARGEAGGREQGRGEVELAVDDAELDQCDIGLPDVDGYEVARVVRGDEALRGTRLIALSGYAQPEGVERAREAGFDEHVAKPPPLDRLNALIGRVSGR